MTGEPTRSSSRAVMAVLVSTLLLSGAVAPAIGFEDTTPTESSKLIESETLDVHGSHPATLSDARVSTLSENGSQSSDSGGETTAATNQSTIPENATTERVTLITGQTVTVVETDNGTEYRVSSDEQMRKVSTGNATYVFPVGVDFSKFDRQLFDVDFLRSQNLADDETDTLPIIVSEAERDHFFVASSSDTGGMLDSVAGTDRRATLDSIDAAAGAIDKGHSKAAYADLAADDSIEQVSLDVKYKLDLQSTDEAVSASSARQTYGVSGNDMKIAIVDSGIDESHPAIDRVVDQRDFTDDTPNTAPDPRGHGTHVAGIVASDNETYTGMAPNASLMDVRVLNSQGWGYTSWIISGIEYATNNNADVISMSIGGQVNYARSNDRYTEAVNAAVENGTLVVTSAGNSGPGYGTVNTPGIQSKALTVGATDASDGDVAWFSSRGPTPYGHYLKPNVLAPGVGVMSTASSDAGYDRSFVGYSGTSMSTPAVSGVAALLLEKHPNWSPERVKSVLTTTADPLDSEDVYTQGAGEINASDALATDLVVSSGTIDFGTFGNDTTSSRNVTVRNLGDSDVTLSPSATATAIESGANAHVTLNESKLTVPAGGKAHLNLTVYTNTTTGVYSGRLSLGEGHSTIFGFVRANEVTVEKSGLDGTSTEGDFVWLFADELGTFDTVGQQGLDQLNGSSTTYHVLGSGEYHVISDGIQEQTEQPIVISKTVTVDGDEQVTLDESNTVTYELDTSKLNAANDHSSLSTRSVEVNYVEETSYGDYGASITNPFADSTAVRFSQSSTLDAAVERLLVPSSAMGTEDNFSAATMYHFVHKVDGVSDSRTTTVDPTELVAKNMTYYRTTRGESYNVTMTAEGVTWFDSSFQYSVTDGIGDRRQQTIYLNDGIASHGVGATSEVGATTPWQLSTSYTGYYGTEFGGYESTLNQHPYVGDAYFNVLDDGDVYYYVAPQVGQGSRDFEDGASDRVRLSLNGTTEIEKTFTDDSAFGIESLDPAPDTEIELTAIGNNGATQLSTRTVTTYTGTYVPGEDYQPPNVKSVEVTGMSANSTVGERLHVIFSTDGDATDATMQVGNNAAVVPFGNDTNNWKSASVERIYDSTDTNAYKATFNVSESFGELTGTLDLAVRAADERGSTVEATTFDAVRVDARDPTMDLTGLGTSDFPAAPDGPVYTNDTVTAAVTANGTPGDARFVAVVLSANFTNYRVGKLAETTDGTDWSVTENLSDLPDDGNYTVELVGVDRHWNVNRTTTNTTVVLDRTAPDLGATITQVNSSTGKVVVSANERLDSISDVRVGKPDGSNVTVTLTKNGDVWEGTFSRTETGGTYNATVNGTDLAGNTGTANSTAEMRTVSTTDREVTVVLEKSGLFIKFRTNKSINDTVTITESRSALAPLSRNLAGLNFLNGELGSKLDANLDNATIGIPVDDASLPPGIARKDVNIRYYNESANGNAGTWEVQDTSVRNVTVDGKKDTYWVTNVTHFSTYGAVVDDDDAPTLDRKTLDGTTLDWGTSHASVEFNYSDTISGVNTSAVEVYFDGTEVTSDSKTNVTSEFVRYNATGLSSGTYTARVEVTDEAGNAVNYTSSFSVETDDASPTVLGTVPDGEIPASDDPTTLTVDIADDVSGVATSAVRVRFDGVDVTGNSFVSDRQVSYTPPASLASGSTHTLEVFLEDAAGNGEWHTFEFTVAEKSSGGSGGGGGGGANVPPPSVLVEVTELTQDHATIRIASARSGSPARAQLPDGFGAGTATFESLRVTPKSSEALPRFILDAETATSPPDSVTAFDAASESLGYVTVTPEYIADKEIDELRVRFAVPTGETAAPENVALYRYDAGSWTKLDTTFVETSDGSHVYRAAASSTGTYAVGLQTPSFEVRDASLDATSVATGESVTVSATVENVGDGAGTYTAELNVDGNVVATKSVELGVGETTTVEFDRAFAAGEHEIVVGDTSAGALSVAGETNTTTGDDDESAGEDESNTGENNGSIPGFGVPVTLGALVALALLARRRSP
ncbi:S8 family serine peptidase [Halorussus halophilus]|uniref:S8 family serine peptidase n=1 Tax=Halorussus halophilus TaxID=2650975 RepID=UPI001300F6F7|nr:S8 family serine peptidase [Halorussus halophilus]